MRESFDKLCLDLNMDNETRDNSWNCYEQIRRHYVLEGDQLHWLAVSLYISCRQNDFKRKFDNNPISIDRLLKSANNLSLMTFFDKLHKWEDMNNLTENIRQKLDQLENAFHISSCIFQKYPKMFCDLFGRNENENSSIDYKKQRRFCQINPKANHLNRSKKCSHQDLFSLGWTLFSLAKTIYPSTFNDLVASFHLLIASLQFLYEICVKAKLNCLIQDCRFAVNCSSNEMKVIEMLCQSYGANQQMSFAIYEEHFQNESFQNRLNCLNEQNCFKTIEEINRCYDEIVLTNCLIDERIFLEKRDELADFCNSFNENRNEKRCFNRTPLTASQHLQFVSNESDTGEGLTPISQTKQLLNHLFAIIGNEQQPKPSSILQDLLQQQTFLDDLMERVEEWKLIYIEKYELIDISTNDERHRRRLHFCSTNQNPFCSNICQRYFEMSLKLFYRALEKIFVIERKRFLSTDQTNQQIQQSFHKLILNNEFLKSLLGLCLLLVFYAHGDNSHDFHWIFQIYSLHGYSFLKIIQIFLRTLKEFNSTRSFIKYLSRIEETILSSMVWTNQSAFWNDLDKKGFLTYQQIFQCKSSIPLTTPTNLTRFYCQSPSKTTPNVSRKLFHQQNSSSSSIVRCQSDPIVENVVPMKLSPYTMFYRKLYELVLSRLHLLCVRLFANQSKQFETPIWNFFLFLFQNYLHKLFRCRDLDQILLSAIYYLANSNLIEQSFQLTWTRLIQCYKSMPNSRLQIVRSVFLYSINDKQQQQQQQQTTNCNPCLTPSKPAGTIHLIDGNFVGDISSFYEQIFLKIADLEENVQRYFASNQFVEIAREKGVDEMSNEHLKINICSNVSIDYSSSQIQCEKHFRWNNEQNNSSQIEKSESTNILSSSIPAGIKNQVQTTRTRTIDGKFLTTISTISTLNNRFDESSPNLFVLNKNESNHFFGQSPNLVKFNSNSMKRTLSDHSQSNLNCLTSLTKKVLQIENDRQKVEKSN